MKTFTRILPVLMIAILSAFFTDIQGKVLTPLLTNGGELLTNLSYYPATGPYGPVTPYDGTGSAEMYSYPLATGTLTGSVKACPTNTNLAGAMVTIVAGTPPVPYSSITNAAGIFTIAGIPVGTCLPVTATFAGYQSYGPVGVNIIANQVTTLNFCMNPHEAMLTGFVTNAGTGAPLVGAKVAQGTLNTNFTYSTGPNGAYTLTIFPAATSTA